jgi:hypothetical protein
MGRTVVNDCVSCAPICGSDFRTVLCGAGRCGWNGISGLLSNVNNRAGLRSWVGRTGLYGWPGRVGR